MMHDLTAEIRRWGRWLPVLVVMGLVGAGCTSVYVKDTLLCAWFGELSGCTVPLRVPHPAATPAAHDDKPHWGLTSGGQ